MVAITGLEVVLVAVKEGISPVPFAPSPMLISSFVQVYTVPATGPVNGMILVANELHIWKEATWVAVGIGFTLMLKVMSAPTQVLAEGVTVIRAVSGPLVVLVAVKEGMFPSPDAARPMVVLLFVQLNAVPATGPENGIIEVTEP